MNDKPLLIEGIVGSVAYGLNTATSDVDYAGIYVEPTERLLGLHPPSRERATAKGERRRRRHLPRTRQVAVADAVVQPDRHGDPLVAALHPDDGIRR